MADVEITFVAKSAPDHESITAVGGAGWWWSVEQVIRSIEAKTNTFYTRVSNHRANVGVVYDSTKKYIRTHAGGRWGDSLLVLPPWPGRVEVFRRSADRGW